MLIPLFTTYGFAVPEDNAAEHIVVPRDLKGALETCVQGEIDNIGMYEMFLNKQLPEDVRDVFERLKNASGNHLRAFRNALSRY
jgi:rubrerythrin